MVELEDPSDPLKMDSLGNGTVDQVSVPNRSLENGDSLFLGRHMRFKRRTVSAKRDFPPGCGRKALKTNGVENVERSTTGGAADVASMGPTGASVESELPKLSKSSNLLESLKPETTDPSPNSIPAPLLEPSSDSKPHIASQSERKETMGDPNRTEALPRKDTVVLLDVSAPVEGTENIVPKKFPSRRVSCRRDFPPGCGRNAPPVVPMEESCEAVTLGTEKPTEDRPLTEVEATVNAKNIAGKSDGNVVYESGEVHCESSLGSPVKKFKGENMKKIGECVAHESRSSQVYMKSQSTSKKVKREVESSVEEVGKVPGKPRKHGDSEREFKSKPVNKNTIMNQSQGEGSSNSDNPYDKMTSDSKIAESEKKEVVIALKALLKKKKNDISSSTNKDSEGKKMTSNSKIAENKKKKVVIALKSLPKKKMNDISSSTDTDSEGKSSVRKPRMGKSDSQKKNKAAVKDEEGSLPHEYGDKNVCIGQDLSVNLIPFGPKSRGGDGNSDKATPRRKVRETLRMFQAICRKLLREEESKSNRPSQAVGRVDLIAVKLLKESNKCVNTGKPIMGDVPGVEIGDEFHYRVELATVGLHRPYQGGIDYMKYKNMIVAISVVASGGYADDMDSSDVLIYSGQGGKPGCGDKQPEDQKLERGNLALRNSIDAGTSVRVIHGYKEPRGSDSQDARGKMITTFTYDGLYVVEKYWQERGDHGCAVFKFQMRRKPGQAELARKVVKKSKKLAVREGLCVKDMSQGKETIPICVVNTIDDDRPSPFKYTTKMIYPSWYKSIPPRGCDCVGGCSDANKCVCVMKNGGEIPFNYNGDIVEAKPLVYECGPSCKCPPSCHNRVSQHGIKFQLEVFKTELRGWGVRSLTSIPSGSFICEYAGELLKDKEAEQRTGNDEYLFDIGHNFTEQSLWDGLSALVLTESQENVSEKVVEDGEYTIDAAEYGNVGRFINHSCSPNLYAQNVLYDHGDKSMPHIMFFAAENIPPLQELTYHYNYTIGQVHDSDGNVKQKNCYCGSHECTGRLY